MDIILIRHGKKTPSLPDQDAPLAPKGLVEVDRLKVQMICQGIKPDIFLTSKYKRARQTAERLSHDANIIHLLDALTPNNNTVNLDMSQTLTAIRDEAQSQGVDLNKQAIVAIVGHEPQLSQLLAYMTSKAGIGKGRGVQVQAASFSAIIQGEGKF